MIAIRTALYLLLASTGCFNVLIRANPCIHVFGDSHSYFGFSEKGVRDYIFNYNNISTPFSIHWLAGKTMHGVGNDGLKVLNFKGHGVKENDVVLLTFGEVDVRAHIGKQRDQQHRTVDEITTVLVNNFFNTINVNRKSFNNVVCVVMAVMPPTNNCYNPQVPFYGQLQDRVEITKLLNTKLVSMCERENMFFLSTHDLIANADGTLNLALSDNCVHVGFEHNYLLRQRLVDMMHAKDLIRIGEESPEIRALCSCKPSAEMELYDDHAHHFKLN